MTNQNKITIIGWAGFIIMLVLFLQRCGSVPGICPTITHTHDTTTTQKWDTITKRINIKVSAPSGAIYIQTPVNIDTAKILEKYFNKYYYSQLIEDSLIAAIMLDTISQNKISGKGFSYHLKQPQHITTINTTKIDTTIISNQRTLYVGGFLASNTFGTSVGIGPQISFATKKQTLYTVNYDLLQKRVELGAHIKIKFGK